MVPWRPFVAGLVVGVVLVGLVMLQRSGRQDAALRAAHDSTAVALSLRHAAIESVTVFVPVVDSVRHESDRLAERVLVTGPTTLTVRLTPSSAPAQVTVPPVVAELIQAQGATIAQQTVLIDKLHEALGADSVVIARQAIELGLWAKQRPRCGRGCGVALGAVGTVVVVALLKAVLH